MAIGMLCVMCGEGRIYILQIKISEMIFKMDILNRQNIESMRKDYP